MFVPTLHPLDGDYDTVLTGFSLRSPIYFPSGVSGAGFNYNLTDSINIGGGYLAGTPTANNPATGLFVGMPSKATSNDISAFEDPDTSLQVEAFYRYMVNDRIGITPGFIVITNPEHNSSNDNIYLGIVRTTFNF